MEGVTRVHQFVLRPYQEESIRIGLDFLLNNKNPENRGVLVEPTGSGKSIITAVIADRLKEGVLVLQPSKELLEQNYQKFCMYGGQASIFSASMKTKEVGDVTFATIGSLKGRQEQFKHIKYVIIDECHLVKPKKITGRRVEHSMYTEFIEGLNNVNVIGLTATPFRLKKFRDKWTKEPYSQINLLPRMRPLFFNSFLHVTQISELYEQGYLCPIKYIPLNWSDNDLVVNTTGAEFADESVEKAMVDQRIIEKIPNMVQQSIDKGRKHRLIFVANVSDAEYLSRNIESSATVSSDTKPKERESILEKFKAGEIKTVLNVGVLTTGFDFPELDTVILARPTMSLSLYMQMIGRGIRLAEGKEYCAVLDMCGNYNRFGEIETLEFKQQPDGRKLWELYSNGKIISNTKLQAFIKK